MEYVTWRSPLPSCYSISVRTADKSSIQSSSKPIAFLGISTIQKPKIWVDITISESQKWDSYVINSC